MRAHKLSGLGSPEASAPATPFRITETLTYKAHSRVVRPGATLVMAFLMAPSIASMISNVDGCSADVHEHAHLLPMMTSQRCSPEPGLPEGRVCGLKDSSGIWGQGGCLNVSHILDVEGFRALKGVTYDWLMAGFGFSSG